MQLGRVSQSDYDIVKSIANPTSVTKERVSEIEAETRHDIMALTKAMAEAAGELASPFISEAIYTEAMLDLIAKGSSPEKAVQMVKDVTAVPEVNKVYMGKVAKIVEFGAFITIMPNQDGLLHVSEIAHERVEKVEDYLKEGEEIEVKVLGIDRGRIKLSRKVLIEK